MPAYKVEGVNVGSFNLGETDKVLTVFTAERGLVKAVAKGARKPGSKIGGRAELLNVNSLLINTGKSIDIITQAESIETFPGLRKDLSRLAFGLYYAELTREFGQGLADEPALHYEKLRGALRLLAESDSDPAWLSLVFALDLCDMLGFRPELTFCVTCREVLTDFKLGAFHRDWGGVVCRDCLDASRTAAVAERSLPPSERGDDESRDFHYAVQITPLVWKCLVLAGTAGGAMPERLPPAQTLAAAQRLVKHYLEARAGRRLKALDLVEHGI
jgi:DNA repair protein RecO (recombination protein O)